MRLLVDAGFSFREITKRLRAIVEDPANLDAVLISHEHSDHQSNHGRSRFDFEIDTFTIPHDATDPVAFCVRHNGSKVGLVTDLGYMPDSVKYHIRGCDFLLLESNHDLEMLKVGPYPWFVKQRVMSLVGHLSNHAVSDFLAGDFDRSSRWLVLGHLSENNNHPEVARMFADMALQQIGSQTRLVVAEQHRPSEVFEL